MRQPPLAAQIRQQFIDFFCQRAGHTFVPSSPVVPHDDPTLLFTNAGMNQFKDVFLGTGTRPYQRAVNSQKCIRAGGKHNDLEDVGRDTYHHTFFEMLGNWSFGDYFKAEAIEWAWELLTKIWNLDPRRLHATYFRGDAAQNLAPDDEARDLWLRFLPKSHVLPFDQKDNFWEMGETGPCGPCSEIHYDGTDDLRGGALVNKSDPRVIEIWNLVFIQFNRGPDKKLTPLPAKHVDTGMGFERITRVLQNKSSNYDTDIWLPIFAAIEPHTKERGYEGHLNHPTDIAYRVIADHVRCLTVAITDGARPSNEGRGYVLRRILRRAVRHGHQTLGVKGPMLYGLVPSVVQSLGDAFPELKSNPKDIAAVIREEEESFLKTLDRGIELFEQAAERASTTFIVADAEKGGRAADQYARNHRVQATESRLDWSSYSGTGRPQIIASDAFQLHDTYGFPIDLTRVMAEERGMSVNEAGFHALMEKARATSRRTADGAEGETQHTLTPDALARLKNLGVEPTQDVDKYIGKPIRAVLRAIWNGKDFDDEINADSTTATVALITDRTNFYAESGGQVGDTGRIVDIDGSRSEFEVLETRATGTGGFVLHVGTLRRGELTVGEELNLNVDNRRDPIRANHTATHLLNLALRGTLGESINQKGSLVAHDRLRFDFSHGHALNMAQLEEVTDQINAAIDRRTPVYADIVPLAEAKKIRGVRAVFGERYPDPVRVVSVGVPVADLLRNPNKDSWMTVSIEFCGGTHLASTDEAQRCVIVSEQALAAGVRRIIALTGPAALAAEMAGRQLLERAHAAPKLADDLFLQEFDEIAKQVDELTLPAVARHRVQTMIETLRRRLKALRKTAESAGRSQAVEQAHQIVDRLSGDGKIIVSEVRNADQPALLAAMDVVRAKRPDAAAMLLSANVVESKVFIVAAVPKEIIDQGLKAGDWVKKAATICGGSGGGRPDMAQAGGKDPTQIEKAIAEARAYATNLVRS